MIGNAAFLAPEIWTSPFNFWLPLIIILSIKPYAGLRQRDQSLRNLGEYQYHKNGDLILDYEYKTRFLLSDGSIISRNEYLQKKENNQIVYVACLVGCTYHCG